MPEMPAQGRQIDIIQDEHLETCGPKMLALNQMQRRFVHAYFEHPNYSDRQLAVEAGYQDRTTGNRLMHDERVIAAINEETSKRLRTGGAIGVMGMIKVALDTAHKDHLKACAMLADRTGFHALSEHKVTVDDKRPETKAELVAAVAAAAKELGYSPEVIKAMVGTEAIEVEFEEIDEEALQREGESL